MKDIIIVFIVCATLVAFAVIGIYVLQQGFIKTGGWMVGISLTCLACMRIESIDKDQK